MQFATMPLPPNDSSGSVSPFVGSTPMLTPMLMNVCTPIHTPMPCATSAANGRVEPRRLAADRVRAKQQPGEERDHRRDAGEAQLLGDHGEQEIGVRLRQVQQLLDARAEADAEPFAAAERDQRMRQLIALVQRIGPRIEEVRQALQAIRRGDQDRGERDRQQHREADEQPPVEAAEEQDRRTRSRRSRRTRRSRARAAAGRRSAPSPRTAAGSRAAASAAAAAPRAGTPPCAPRSSRRRAPRELHELGRLDVDDAAATASGASR